MTAAVHFLTAPAGPDLTDDLLAHARAAAHADPGSVLWLGPSARALDDLRRRLARHGFVGVRWSTFADLAGLVLEDQPAPRLLSSAQRRLIVEEVVADLAARAA